MRAKLRDLKPKIITIDKKDHHCLPTQYKDYFATTLGHIVSTKLTKPIVLKPWVNDNGYLLVQICRKNIRVHRLVAETFLESPATDKDASKRLEVNHIDGNKVNNKVANLEWNSQAENRLHHQMFKELFQCV